MDAAVGTLKFENKAVIPTDPRTKLFLTVTVSTIMITGGTGGFMNLVRPCLMACPIVFLLLSRKWGAAARFAVTCAILFALELTVLPLLTGTWNFILGAAVGIYTHMLPGFIMGYYLVSTTTVSEFVAAMEKMHIPQKIVIPMSVVFRFFPTVKEEYNSFASSFLFWYISIISYYRLFVCSKFYSPVLSCTAHAAPQPHKRAKRRVFWLFRIRVLRVASAPHRADLGGYCE